MVAQLMRCVHQTMYIDAVPPSEAWRRRPCVAVCVASRETSSALPSLLASRRQDCEFPPVHVWDGGVAMWRQGGAVRQWGRERVCCGWFGAGRRSPFVWRDGVSWPGPMTCGVVLRSTKSCAGRHAPSHPDARGTSKPRWAWYIALAGVAFACGILGLADRACVRILPATFSWSHACLRSTCR
jgi:hypothetical protein